MSEFLEMLHKLPLHRWPREDVLSHIESLEPRDQGIVFTASGSVLKLDLDLKKCYVRDVEVIVTVKQFKFLQMLVVSSGKIVPVRDIMKTVWGSAYDESNSQYIRVLVSELRKKLGEEIILTRPGHGYMVEM